MILIIVDKVTYEMIETGLNIPQARFLDSFKRDSKSVYEYLQMGLTWMSHTTRRVIRFIYWVLEYRLTMLSFSSLYRVTVIYRIYKSHMVSVRLNLIIDTVVVHCQ